MIFIWTFQDVIGLILSFILVIGLAIIYLADKWERWQLKRKNRGSR